MGVGWKSNADVGTVSSVNEIAPDGGGNVSLAATDIPSTGPSTVQGDLDALKYIESAADLDARFPAVAGIHTIDQGSEWRLPAGATEIDITPNRIVGVYPGGVVFVGGRGVIESDVDAPLVSGELSFQNVTWRNTGIGVAALCVNLESLFGRELNLNEWSLEGLHPGRLANVFNIGKYGNLTLVPSAPGATSLEIDGTNAGALFTATGVLPPGTTPYTGIRILATASLDSASIQSLAVLGAVAGDSGIYIDAAATVGTVISVFLCEATGLASVIDPTGIEADDPRMLTLTNVNAEASKWLGDVIYDSAGGAAISLTMSGGVEVMPNQNVGPTALAALTSGSERFVYDNTALQDWELRSTSRNDAVQGEISWFATVKRNGGTIRDFIGWIQYRTGPDPAVWQTINESKGKRSLNTTYDSVGGSAPFQWDRTYEFRLVVQGTVATNTDIEDWRIQIGLGRP